MILVLNCNSIPIILPFEFKEFVFVGYNKNMELSKDEKTIFDPHEWRWPKADIHLPENRS